MAAFASPDWIDDLARAAGAIEPDPDLSLVVEQRIDEPEIAWHFRLDRGSMEVGAGRAADPTITLSCSFATASAIHAGELSAQRAFLDGELRIGGELNALITNRAALSEVAILFGRGESPT